MRVLRRHRTGNADIDRLSDSLQEWSAQLDRVPWLDGVLLEGVALSAGNNVIAHKLGRAPRGWWLARRVRAAGDANYPAEIARDKDTITLNATGGETVSLWVW